VVVSAVWRSRRLALRRKDVSSATSGCSVAPRLGTSGLPASVPHPLTAVSRVVSLRSRSSSTCRERMTCII
jgi:hypothetical protein